MKAFLLILSFGWYVQGFAQQEYFVFVQSENRQPFYVRIGEKNHSSSATGHLILSKLKDSAYVFTVGFPQGQFAEQEFTVRISKKDRGYELKNLGEKGWALFDWQTMELISPAKPVSSGSGGAAYSLVKKNDDFARLMAGVVNDTAVMYTVVMEEKKQPVMVAKETATSDVAKVENKPAQLDTASAKKPDLLVETKKPEEQKADTVRAVNPVVINTPAVTKDNAVKDSVIAKADPVKDVKDSVIGKVDAIKDSAIAKVDPPAKKPEQDPMKDSVLNPPALPVISVVKQFATDTGYYMLVVDELKDSINIFIPADAPVQEVKEKKQEEKPVQKIITDTVQKLPAPEVNPPKKDTEVKKKDTAATNVPAGKEVRTDTVQKETKLVMMNSDCRSFATSNDVDKLRVKLINEKDSEDRITAAKKVFKTRCFSAQQIKALSELFPYDEQKYKFLEMAYPFVSDTGNFKGLVSLLQDPVYAQRFRKLVRLD